MLTAANLKSYTAKDLAQMAKQRGIAGWHGMRKEQLIKALTKSSKSKKSSSRTKVAVSKKAPAKNGASVRNGSKNGSARNGAKAKNGAAAAKPTAAQKKIKKVHNEREKLMDIATGVAGALKKEKAVVEKDRIVLMVRDSYWLQAYWELTPQCVQRSRAALAEKWHSARPVLRLLRVPTGGSANGAEEIVRIVDIHGAVNNWYIDVLEPPKSYRVEIGYQAGEHFHGVARSNVVQTPRPGSSEMVDRGWSDVVENSEKIYAMSGGYDASTGNGELQEMFEERLRRPLGSPMVTRFGDGVEAALNKDRNMEFSIDAEMIVYGVVSADAFVTMAGEPVKLQTDGSFTARVGLPDRRQVIPIVASSSDGVEERTIVLAVERNTKVMEPKLRQPGE